jgi:hypothetical protein
VKSYPPVKVKDLGILVREQLAAAIKASVLTKAEICRRAGINRVTLNRHLNGPPACMTVDNLLSLWQVLVAR